MGFNQNHHSPPNAAAADGGVSQRLNSPRFSRPMTRRAQSFKRNNNNGHEIDLHLNSPRSELGGNSVSFDGFDSAVEKKQTHLHLGSHRVHGKKPTGFGLRERKKLGQWMFFVFCGLCLFLGVLKICANGWFGSAIDRVGSDRVSPFPLWSWSLILSCQLKLDSYVLIISLISFCDCLCLV